MNISCVDLHIADEKMKDSQVNALPLCHHAGSASGGDGCPREPSAHRAILTCHVPCGCSEQALAEGLAMRCWAQDTEAHL